MTNLEGKVAFITGAARAQGRAHAVTLAAAGADIVALDVHSGPKTIDYNLATREELDETAALVEKHGRQCLAITADIRSTEEMSAAVSRAVDAFGKLDILVANAGIHSMGLLHELSDEQWGEMLDINLTGTWKTLRAVAPHMIERKAGVVVLISSINGLEGGPRYAHYTASKHGIIGLMRTAAIELGPLGIRVNALCPGVIDTPMTNYQGLYDMMKGGPGGTRADYEAGATHYGLLPDLGALSPQVIADALEWLVSDKAYAVAGQAIPVDAGHLIIPGLT